MEEIILKALLSNDEYFALIFPYLKKQLFEDSLNAEIFELIEKFYKKYGKEPTLKDIAIFLKNQNIPDKRKQELAKQLKTLADTQLPENENAMLQEIQEYLQRAHLTLGILESAEIIEKGDDFNKVIALIEGALQIDFDRDLGLLYNNSLSERWKYYTTRELGISTGLKCLDKDMNGGWRSKTLNIVVAPSHGGKTMFLINSTANLLLRKKNVIYFTLEIPELEIAKRIDANLLSTPTWDLSKMSQEEYFSKMQKLDLGQLVIKEYPAGTLNTLKIKNVLKKLKAKEGFDPDIIVIDYLGIMASSRLSLSSAGGLYQYYKLISEELHALAKELDKPILTAAQLNRSAYNNTDAGMDLISDSIGIVQTADTIIAMLSSEKMRQENQVLLKFLKNRATGRLSSHIVEFKPEIMTLADLDTDETQIEKPTQKIPDISQVQPNFMDDLDMSGIDVG